MIRWMFVFVVVLFAVQAEAKEPADEKVSALAIAPQPFTAEGGLPNISTAAFEAGADIPKLEDAPAPNFFDSKSCLAEASLLSGMLWQPDAMNFNSEYVAGAVGRSPQSDVPIPEFVASMEVERRHQVANAVDTPHGLARLSGGMYLTGR